LRLSKSINDFFFGIVTFVRNITNKSFTDIYKDFSDYFLCFSRICFGTITNLFDDITSISGAHIQSNSKTADFIQQLRSSLDDFDKISSSKFATKLVQFLTLIVCTPICKSFGITTSWFGFGPLHQRLCEKKYKQTNSATIVYDVVDSALFLIEKLTIMVDTGNSSCLYIDDKEILDYDEEFTFLTYYYDRLELLANNNISLSDYFTRCDELIQKGNRIKEYYVEDKKGLPLIKSHQNLLAKCKLRCGDKMKVSSERDTPIAMVLCGPPGIGKSALIDKILTMSYQNAKELNYTSLLYDPKMKYVYNHDDQYMSEFRSSHTVCVIDDVDQFQATITEQDGGGALRHSISFINPVPYVTNQAELANKGMIPFLCDYVMMTTNTHDAGISKVFQAHGGARRRFLFLDIKVKDQYRKSGQTQLLGDVDNPYNHELHVFHPRRYESVGTKSNEKFWDKENLSWVDAPGDGLNLRELGQFLYEHIQKPHYAQNTMAKNSVSQFITAPYCTVCKCSSALCEHSVTQSSHTMSDYKRKFINIYDWFVPTVFLAMALCYSQYFFAYFVIRKNVKVTGVVSNLISYITPRRLPTIAYEYLPYKFTNFVDREILYANVFSKGDNIVKGQIFSYYNMKRNEIFVKKGVATLLKLLLAYKALNFISRSIVTPTIQHKNKKKVTFDDNVGQSQGNTNVHLESLSSDDNYWVTNTVPLERLSAPYSTVTLDQLKKVVTNNTCRVKLYFSKHEYITTTALGLYGNIIAIAAHTLDDGNDHTHISLIRHNLKQKIGPSRYNLILNKDDIWRHPTLDYALIRHSGFGTFKDIRKFFKNDNLPGNYKGCLVTRDLFGVTTDRSVDAFTSYPVKYTGYGKIYSITGYKGCLEYHTKVGDCGSPYIVSSMNGHFIAGIHVAGHSANEQPFGYATPIDVFEFDDNRFVPHSCNGLDLNNHYTTEQDLTLSSNIHPKSPVIQTAGSAQIYGTLNIHVSKPKTHVKPTLMHDDVLKFYNINDCGYQSPMEVKASLAVKQNVDKCLNKAIVDTKTIYTCEDSLFAWYSKILIDNKVVLPSKPYSIAVGINGIDGVSYVDRLPINTSGGFAHKGRKDKYLNLLPNGTNNQVEYGLTPQIQLEYNKLREDYLLGSTGNVIFDYNYKDEPLSDSKVARNKCRLFSSGPLHFTIMVRQYYLWIIPLMSGRLRTKFGMAIGTNCASDDWDEIYNHLITHGKDRLIAGDYGSYDKVMPPEVMCSAFNVLIRIATAHGWSKTDLTIMKGLATDICYPKTNIFGSVVQFFGTNPSGHSLTTPINGMCNIIYIMMACCDIAQEINILNYNVMDFPNHIAIVTYGDDNAMSSKYDYFNHTSISSALAKRGIEYTMADKSSESVPFINISEVSFLKRVFVKDRLFIGKHAAPLEHESILKMLCICTASRTIFFEQQCAEILYSASRELTQYGRSVYTYHMKFFERLLIKYVLWPYLPNSRLLSFDEQLLVLNPRGDRIPVPDDGEIIVEGNFFKNLLPDES